MVLDADVLLLNTCVDRLNVPKSRNFLSQSTVVAVDNIAIKNDFFRKLASTYATFLVFWTPQDVVRTKMQKCRKGEVLGFSRQNRRS
jgi:hypothetical protein